MIFMVSLWDIFFKVITLTLKKPLILPHFSLLFTFLFFFVILSSAYIAHKDKDQTSQWPTAWRLNTPENRDQSQIIINEFQHENIDVQRFADRIVKTDEVNYKIEENSKKPSKHFQSFHFHHTSAGASLFLFFCKVFRYREFEPYLVYMKNKKINKLPIFSVQPSTSNAEMEQLPSPEYHDVKRRHKF